MKPAGFKYLAPASIDEAVKLLAGLDDARVLAGGQSLLPMMNFRLASPAVLVDLNRIPSLAGIEDRGEVLEIGAMTRQRAIEFSPVVAKRLPLLQEAVRLVGHLPTRTRGTIGGSLAQADPSAELPLIAVLLDADIVVRGADGERLIKASAFFQSVMTTALEAGEIITAVRLPIPAAGTGWAIDEFARRSGDFAIASVAVVVGQGSGTGTRCRAGLAVGGAGPIPVRLRRAEQLLEHEGLGEGSIAEACNLAAQEIEPMADHNASIPFRRHLVSVLLGRTLRKAMERCERQ